MTKPTLRISQLPMALALAGSAFYVVVHAQSGPPGGAPHGPPPEAIAACQGKTAGAQASFTGRDGRTFTGICTQIGHVLAIAPPSGLPPGASSAGAR